MYDDKRGSTEVEEFIAAVEGRREPHERKILERANHVFNLYCKMRCHLRNSPLSVEDLFPVDPETIVRHVLEINYFEVDKIEGYDEFKGSQKSMTEIAGLIDRLQDKIVIAKKFKPEWRRYTGAHEIAHYVLHPDVTLLRERAVYLRERPVTGHEREHLKRPPEEKEADTFGAELLMPTSHLIKTFFKRFGGPINMSRPSEVVEFWFPSVKGDIDPRLERATKKKMIRARTRLVASFSDALFPSMVERYGVSQTAMSIQLENLGLVF
ncbi:MAG TPA: ImmA/IrrE family metallo-endopeptidase [Pyrinomonadaceae bacterium]|jgi:hypothetical protein|nr:ImmA/IrrE family metallo-endopeptidase [Pyrinomonadaceae bacterium]